ncbi:MAG TPA: hypothetical protein VKS79_12670 [Gemmataceae bacterium]|nr:hypothetical protein [Gemmataceae bacterium]
MRTTGFLLLLPLLLAAEPPKPEASRVSLDPSAKTVAEAAASVSKQANIPIDVSRALTDKPVRLTLQNVPFWEALDQLAKASNHRLSISAQGSKIALFGGPSEEYGQAPVDVQGPFRFSGRKTLGKIDLETGQSTTEVDIDIVWEPRFKAFYAEVPPKSLSAWDNDDKPLQVAGEGSGKLPVTGTAVEITARLNGVPRAVKRIGRLEGEIHFTGTTQMLQFSFAADATGDAATSKKEDISATLKQFEKKGRIWTALIEFDYPKGGPEFESFQSFLLDNQCWLVHRDGRRFLNQGLFELLGEHNGKYPVAYRFVENEKTGFVIGNPKDWQVVLRTPGRITTVPVKFRLNNIALP